MKKLFTLLLFSSVYFCSTAQNNKIDSLINRLSTKISASQFYFNPLFYPDIAYIRDKYNVPNLHKNDSVFIKMMNDIKYKRFYTVGKLLDKNYKITEDCITEENLKLIDAYKLFYYSLYDNIKLPKDYIKRLETASKEDNLFFSAYYTLRTIYFLKEYNNAQLSSTDKAQLKTLEDKISKYLYDEYIKDKPWSFYKIVSTAMLSINKNKQVENLDISELIDYFLTQGQPTTNVLDIDYFKSDTQDSFLLSSIGMDKVSQMQSIYTLWIILEKKSVKMN